jgi:hypothetical protein
VPLGVFDRTIHLVGGEIDKMRGEIGQERFEAQLGFRVFAQVSV